MRVESSPGPKPAHTALAMIAANAGNSGGNSPGWRRSDHKASALATAVAANAKPYRSIGELRSREGVPSGFAANSQPKSITCLERASARVLNLKLRQRQPCNHHYHCSDNVVPKKRDIGEQRTSYHGGLSRNHSPKSRRTPHIAKKERQDKYSQ